MSNTSSSLVVDLAMGLTAGVLIPLGQPPLGVWIFTCMGLLLTFYRLQLVNGYRAFITSLGLACGYLVSGQIWIYCSQYILMDISLQDKLLAALMMFVYPITLLTLIFSIYPKTLRILNLHTFSTYSSLLFGCAWMLFEVLYALNPDSLPLLLSGYTALKLPLTTLLPLLGIFGSGLFLALFMALLGCIAFHLKQRQYLPLRWVLPALLLVLGLPVFLARFQWTWPHDTRPFHYVMQIQLNADSPDNFHADLLDPQPRVVILGGIESQIERPNLYNRLQYMNTHKNIAYLSLFPQMGENCPDIFCSFGEGEGCIEERRPFTYNFKGVKRFQAAGSLPACKSDLPMMKINTSMRSPAVDTYRVLVLSKLADALPFLVAESITGSELIVAYDTNAEGQVIRDRLLNADRARARETGRPVLRYSNMGTSAEINYMGEVETRFLPEQELVTGTLQPMTGRTPFVQLGILAPIGAILMILVFFVYRRLLQTL